jgi:hypothetical protein
MKSKDCLTRMELLVGMDSAVKILNAERVSFSVTTQLSKWAHNLGAYFRERNRNV